MSAPSSHAGRSQVQDIYPLTPIQHGLLFHTLLAPDSGMYAEQLGYDLRGVLDVEAFKRAWQEALHRHPVLRSAFVTDNLKEPLQLVRASVELPWREEDWRGIAAGEQRARLAQLFREQRELPFALDRPPLLRLALVRLADDHHKFFWTFHHALMDGWSVALVLHEVQLFYQASLSGHRPSLPQPRPFRDFIGWLKGRDRAAAESFWREWFGDFEAPTPLRIDRQGAVPEGEDAYDTKRLRIPAATSAALRELAARHDLTLNTVVQGAWAILLSRYAGANDVVYGITSAGRPAALPGSDGMIGLFINTLPVRARVDGGQTLVPFLAQLQAREVELREHEHTPLVDIHGWSSVPRGFPLFESFFVYESYPVQPFAGASALGLAIERDDQQTRTNYPLTVLCAPAQEIELSFAYDRRRLDRAAIERMAAHYETLLSDMVARPDRPIAELRLLPPAERARLLEEWNATERAYPHVGPAHRLFEAQARRTPDAVAVTAEGSQLTYRELDARASRLARHLGALGVGPETRVGLFMSRSPEMVVAVLAVLKAGGTYVAVDPEYPEARIAYILADSRAAVILTECALLDRLPEHAGRTVAVDSAATRTAVASEPAVSPGLHIDPRSLSHIIYTSGSTGQPKGVAIEHRSVAVLVQWSREHYGDAELDGVLAATSLCFDLSVWELMVPLSYGGTVVVADHALALARIADAGRVTLVNTVPSAIAELVRQEAVPASVGTVNLAGEPLTTRLADQIYALGTVRRVCDLYGPSEDTTYSTYAQRRPGGVATIGVPLANTRAVLEGMGPEPTPTGVPGELLLSGEGLARGYLGRPHLTAERFVPDAHARTPGERAYRTGDLIRWLPEGTLEYLGRIDHQVKIRGFRIELGEIEAALARYPGLRDVLVMALEDGPGAPRRLVAYVAHGSAPAPEAGALRAHLKTSLPEYMIPSAFVTMAALPLTPNGKVDRQALRAAEAKRNEVSDVVPPGTETERVIAEIWCELLQRERVSIHDNFYELGGHSLIATQIVSRIRRAFPIQLEFQEIFGAATVAELATVVDNARWAAENASQSTAENARAQSQHGSGPTEEGEI